MANPGSWKKGQSGNPGGKRKIDYAVRDMAKVYTPEALAVLRRIMKQSPDDRARVAAANSLLDRGWGKPAQSVDITNSDGSMSAAWMAAVKSIDGVDEAQEQQVEH